MLKMILAVGENGEIGKEGKLPWSLPEDLNYFKEVTSGATVVMGGNTFRSLEHFGGHGLPNRDNVVLTREVPKLDKTGYRLTDKGVLLVNEQYLQHTLRFGSIMQDKDMFLIGGSEMYNKYAHMCDEYHISLVEGSFENTDKFFDISSIWESTEDKEVIKFDGFKVHVRVPKSVKDDFDLD